MFTFFTKRMSVLALAFGLVVVGGCGSSRMGGRLYEKEQWRLAEGKLGKVTLVIAGDVSMSGEEVRIGEIARAATASLEKLPDTTVMDDPSRSAFVSDMGDREAVELGKRRGADSVCVMTVGGYGGRFGVDVIPPGWSATSSLLCSIRLLDVRTGDLLMHSVSFRQDGGMYGWAEREDSLKALTSDLSKP